MKALRSAVRMALQKVALMGLLLVAWKVLQTVALRAHLLAFRRVHWKVELMALPTALRAPLMVDRKACE